MPIEDNSGAFAYLAVLGSLASIISIVINIFQGIAHRNLKHTFQATLLSGEKTFRRIAREATSSLNAHAAERESSLKSIKSAAEGAEEHFVQIRRKRFGIKTLK